MPDWGTLHWRPVIGDPTFMGWLTVVLYFLCAWQCLRVLLQAPQLFQQQTRRQRGLWLFLAMAMCLLGINKQLDLQTLFTEIGKYFAHRDNWYDHRRDIQKRFIEGMIAIGLMTVLIAAWGYRHSLKQNLLALLGFTFLIVFVIVRATSFHHMDRFIGTRFIGLKMNWILEIGGILMILLNAVWLQCQVRQPKP